MEKDDLTSKHNPDWALFLPALSTFYITGLGKQRKGENYFPPERIPQGVPDLEALNFLNSQKALFPYKWALYSAGHAELDPKKQGNSESIVHERESGTFLLGDSGGFQILKCQWPADWKDPNCPKAQKKREQVLRWMDTYMDYGMVLDIPSQSLTTYHLTDPKTDKIDEETGKPIPGTGKSWHGIKTIEDAVTATHINNKYFIENRSGKCKFLNVLQGRNHTQSDEWYQEMKDYCDPKKYPDNHFNGWAFGGQTKIDISLFLKRLVHIIHDDLLQPGVHDWIHCLGTSILEWSLVFSDTQRALRKHVNPNVTISFDCASPFFSAAKGLAYFNNTFEHNTKWSYQMEKTAENKGYANDNRKFKDAVLAEGIHQVFTDSPITANMTMRDLCYRGKGFLGQHNKETKTSWDTLSYTLLQGHNVYQHMVAVQEANRKYDSGVMPKMVLHEKFVRVLFKDVVDEIIGCKDRQEALDKIEEYNWFWNQFKSGSQGFSGRKTTNAMTAYDDLFIEVESKKLIVVDEDEDNIDDTEILKQLGV
jgi:hypothetical protein